MLEYDLLLKNCGHNSLHKFSDILFTQESCLVMEMCKWENPILYPEFSLISKNGRVHNVVGAIFARMTPRWTSRLLDGCCCHPVASRADHCVLWYPLGAAKTL